MQRKAWPVTVVPGPSALDSALVLSGMPVDRFAFVGFLVRGRVKLIQQLAVFDGTGAAVVAFESPRRVRASLEAIGERWPERRMAVCRELTKMHEEVLRGTAGEVLAELGEPVRGRDRPCDGAIPEGGRSSARGAPPEFPRRHGGTSAERRWRNWLRRWGGDQGRRRHVSRLTGLSSKRAYELALEAKRRD